VKATGSERRIKLRRLSERDGLPPLPRAEIRLHRAPKLSRAATLLADHLVASLTEPVRRKGRAPLRFRTLRRVDHRHCSAAVRATRTEVVLAY
jgi:hypothetical protein